MPQCNSTSELLAAQRGICHRQCLSCASVHHARESCQMVQDIEVLFKPHDTAMFLDSTFRNPELVVSWSAKWPCPVGKPSATGQPTRSTQPIILPGWI